MDPLVAKAVAPIASILRTIAVRLTLSLRTAREVVGLASSRDLKVVLKELRLALRGGAVERHLKDPSASSRAAAINELQVVRLRPAAGGEIHDGVLLLDLVERARQRRGSSNEAVILLEQRLGRSMALDSDGAGSTAPTRIPMSPSLLERSEQLRTGYDSDVSFVLSAISVAPDRMVLLREWAQDLPPRLADNPDILGWLGEIASDAGALSAANQFLNKALDVGVSPRAYWKFRRVGSDLARDPDESLKYLADVLESDLIQAVLAKNSLAVRRAALDRWDARTPSELNMKLDLDLQFAIEANELDEVVKRGEKEYRENSRAFAALRAGEALLRRSFQARSTHFQTTDASRARDLALDVRDKQRGWGSASTDAVVLAIHASVLLVDPDGALRLAIAEPAGLATQQEAESRAVRQLRLELQAGRGQIREALDALDDDITESTRLQIRATAAELAENPDEADGLWSEAISATEDWQEKAALCFRLALKGRVDAFVDELEAAGNAEVARELRLIAALATDDLSAEVDARREAEVSPRVARALINKYHREGRLNDYVAMAERTAQLFGTADEWLLAAQGHAQLGAYDVAVARAQAALTSGGESWGDRYRAFDLIFQVALFTGDWRQADLASRQLLQSRPDDPTGQWAVLLTRYNSGDVDGAFVAWSSFTEKPEPQNEEQATVWLNLYRLHGADIGTAQSLLKLLQRFERVEHLRVLGIAALSMAPNQDMDDGTPTGDLSAAFERDFPSSNAFVRIEQAGETVEEIIASLDALQTTPLDTSAIDEAVEFGRVPLGLVARLTGGSYLELALRRSRLQRFLGEPAADLQKVVASASNGPVVADTSAFLTLAQLSPEVRGLLRAHFSEVSGTVEQLMDANAARESLSRPSQLRFIPTTTAAPAHFEFDDEDERRRREAIARDVVSEMTADPRTPLARREHVVEGIPAKTRGAWSSSVEAAKRAGRPLWCDDASLRSVAQQADIPAFSTLDLIAALDHSDVAVIQHDLLYAQLMTLHVIGVPYGRVIWELAAELDGFRAAGVSQVLRYGSSENLDEKIQLVFTFIERRLDDPTEVGRWAAAQWAAMVNATRDPDAQTQNCLILALQTIQQIWLNSDTAPFVVAGWKAVDPLNFEERFGRVVRRIYAWLIARSTHSVAAESLLKLFSGLPDTERLVVVEAILRSS